MDRRLKLSDSALFDFVESFSKPAHLKDPCSKEYFWSNYENLNVYGLNKPDEIIGLTVHDLDQFMKPYWGKEFAGQVGGLDDKVVNKNITVSVYNRTLVDKFGLLHIQNMTKTPILNNTNRVSGILTISSDITDNINLFYIFSKYRKIYKKKRDACIYFMKYLKIDSFFCDVLSEKEFVCMLHMIESNTYKGISNKMNVSRKTVETHIRHIICKLRSKTLNEILEYLRNRNYYGTT